MKILIKKFENHPEGYGFIKDLVGESLAYGISPEDCDKILRDGFEISTEFIPNGKFYYYEAPLMCEMAQIRLGTLNVYKEKSKK